MKTPMICTHTIPAAICLAIATLAPCAATGADLSSVTEWKQVQVVGGGFVTGIVCHPAEKNLIYARTDVGGAYRWDEATQSWIPLLDWLPHGMDMLNYVISLAVDPTDPERLYIVSGYSLTEKKDECPPTRLLRSKDRGKTFEMIDAGFLANGNADGRSNGERLMVDPNCPNILYYGSQDMTRLSGGSYCHLYRSEDFGSTWKALDSFPISRTDNGNGIVFVEFDAASGKSGSPTPSIYVGVSQDGSALYRSNDAGKTWKLVPNQPTKETVGIWESAGKPKRLLAQQAEFDGTGNLFVTFADNPGPNDINHGDVFKLDTKNGIWKDVTPVHARGGYAGVSVNRAGGLVAVSTMDRWGDGDRVFISSDGGASWHDMKSGDYTVDFSEAPWMTWHKSHSREIGHWTGDVEIDPFNPDRIFLISGGGVMGASNTKAALEGKPVAWEVETKGIEEMCLCVGSSNAMISPPSGAHLYVVFGDVDGFRFDNFDKSPENGQFFPTYGSSPSIDFAELNPLFLVRTHWGDGPGGSYSEDGGLSWKRFNREPLGARIPGPGSIAVSADGKTLVWVPQGKTAYRSVNKGDTWTHSKSDMKTPPGYMCLRVTSDRVNPDNFYVLHMERGTVYYSNDGGKSFAEGGFVPDWNSCEIKTAPGMEGHVWVCADKNWKKQGLLLSTDGGKKFVPVSNIEASRCIGFGKAAEGSKYPTLYLYGKVGGTWGIYISTNYGRSWNMIRETGWGYIDEIDGDPREFGRVYVGCGGRGVFTGLVKWQGK
jgi:photosystem II stability/assembly factor-like uncharacterized protein